MPQNQMVRTKCCRTKCCRTVDFSCTTCDAVFPRVHIDISESDVLIGFPAPLARVWRRLMAFDRAAQHHHDRLEDAVREEITALLEGGLADPRIGLVTVNVVELMPKGKTAHVYVSVSGSQEEAETTLTALQAAKGYIRHELALRLQARKAPDLMFHLDRSDVIEKKIEAVRAREKRKRD